MQSYYANEKVNAAIFINTVTSITNVNERDVSILGVSEKSKSSYHNSKNTIIRLMSENLPSVNFNYQISAQLQFSSQAATWYTSIGSILTISISNGNFTAVLQINAKNTNSNTFDSAVSDTLPVISQPEVSIPPVDTTTAASESKGLPLADTVGIAIGCFAFILLVSLGYYHYNLKKINISRFK